jgi:lysyl-tRNA synthetase class 2
VNVFQISKCYRNYESLGAVHNPEFTMLEYYTMNASYKDSAALTEELFAHLSSAANMPPSLSPPFTRMTMDAAFESFAGFRLSDARNNVPELCTAEQLAGHARRLGIAESAANPFDAWAWDDLYELILAHAVEPKLPRGRPVLVTDYPARVPCLAKDIGAGQGEPLWKERWELYADGIELANCYSEETCPRKVKEYFEREGRIKDKSALVPHAYDTDYWKIFESPRGHLEFSGVALGVDRLAALMTGSRAIESVMPFAFGTSS